MSGGGISRAICKSAPRSWQITTPVPHHSVFYRPDTLPAAQPIAPSTEGRSYRTKPYKFPMHCSKRVSFWGGLRTLDPLLIPHFPPVTYFPPVTKSWRRHCPEACCRPWTWWCNDATALAGYATMMMTQNRSPHAISGPLSAFEKWSGHEVPKCCRKGRGSGYDFKRQKIRKKSWQKKSGQAVARPAGTPTTAPHLPLRIQS